VSLALNHSLGGLNPWGYHAFNLAIHIAAALALFGVVRRTLPLAAARPITPAYATLFAAATALLWALHPLQTAAVSYVVQRAESMMALFYLLTLYGFIRAAHDEGTHSKAWGGFALTACALGMATKEVMVSAPLIVFLYDRTFVAGTFREAWRRRKFLHLGMAAMWIILGSLLFTSSSRGGTAGFSTGVPWWAYLLTQSAAILHYLRLAVWPHPLVFDYGTGIVTQIGDVGWPLLAISLLAVGSLLALWRRPIIGFLGVSFFALLAPSSSVVPVASEVMAEHRMYLPLATLVVGAITLAHRRFGTLSLIPGGIAVIALGLLTAERNNVYRDEVSLWNDTATKAPANPRAHFNLAEGLVRHGQTFEAIQHYEEAIRLRPNFASAHCNLSHVLFEAGRIAEARSHAEEALRYNPALPEAHNNLANALFSAGDVVTALDHYREAVRLNPDDVTMRNNLGTALSQLGLLAEAAAQYTESLKRDAGNPSTHLFLGNIHARAGRFDEAERCYQEALRLKPGFLPAQEKLERVRALQKK
jgi:Flp pilus assembly protein TadD